MPVDDRTFSRIRVSNHQSWLSSKAMHAYLATKGRNKQGISVIKHDNQGNPVYSSGELAAIERNILRYHLAFSAYFKSRNISPDSRYEASLVHWFDATEQHPQLFEMTREQYLKEKRLERENQLALQEAQSP